MHLALASLDSAWEDKPRSLARCRSLAERAAARGAELLVFPEMTLTGFTMQATSVTEPTAAAPTIRAFAELARTHRIAIAFGVVLDGRLRPQNRLVVVAPDGRELASYAKLHPFSHAGEDRHYESGDCSAIAAVGDVAFGLSICYDLRFPEVYSAVAERVSALLVIANWPSPRIAHWFALLQARAIESQCYAFGVNRTGQDPNGHEYPRSSCGFDPAGERLQPEWSEAELDGFTIDVARVQELRARLGFLRDRRPEIYRRLLAPTA